MGQLPAGMVAVVLPVGQEVVAAVVPETSRSGMHRGDLVDVRRVEDDLAPVGHDRFDLVEAFGPGPEVGVAGGDEREHALDRAVEVFDMGVAATSAAAAQASSGAPKASECEPAGCRDRPRRRGHGARPGTRRSRRVDQCPHRRDAPGADDGAAGDECAEPVRDVDELLAGQVRGRDTCSRPRIRRPRAAGRVR